MMNNTFFQERMIFCNNGCFANDLPTKHDQSHKTKTNSQIIQHQSAHDSFEYGWDVPFGKNPASDQK